MADRPVQEFGKRGRVSVPDAPRNVPPPPAKRSGNVALLLMGTVAVGSVAWTMLPNRNCEQPNGYATQNPAECPSRSSSSGGHGGSGGSSWRSGSSGGGDSSSSSSHSSSVAGSPVVARSGFGSFGHAIGFSGG
jgi:uncharacterized membrane protein YgcG